MNHLMQQKRIQQPLQQQQLMPTIELTLTTAWYCIPSKFPPEMYYQWMQNLFALLHHVHLVVYTNAESFSHLVRLIPPPFLHTRVKVIIKPVEEWHVHRYEEDFLTQEKETYNVLLNMLWNEKAFLVKETIQQRYFDTLLYGWCDIGYFRNRPRQDTPIRDLMDQWASPSALLTIADRKIHIGQVVLQQMQKQKQPNPSICKSMAGGFFVSTKDTLLVYAKLYDDMLQLLFSKNKKENKEIEQKEQRRTIKDDQVVIQHVVEAHPHLFHIHHEFNPWTDPWFMFQRILL